MDKKIPKVFANDVNSRGNNKGVFYSSHDEVIDLKPISSDVSFTSNEKNINQKIKDIFNSSSYVYKADVDIKLKSGNVTKRIVGKNSTHLITMDNELIPISDILDIKKK